MKRGVGPIYFSDQLGYVFIENGIDPREVSGRRVGEEEEGGEGGGEVGADGC